MKNKQEFEEFIEKLQNTDKLIIVEGVKDKKALEFFGASKIITLSKKPLFEIVENISKSHKHVIILTDLDIEGKKLYAKLKKDLTERGVTVDNYFREFLFQTQLTHIEGLVGYLGKRKLN